MKNKLYYIWSSSNISSTTSVLSVHFLSPIKSANSLTPSQSSPGTPGLIISLLSELPPATSAQLALGAGDAALLLATLGALEGSLQASAALLLAFCYDTRREMVSEYGSLPFPICLNCCQGSLTSVLGWVFPAHSIEFRVRSSYFFRPN